MRIRAFVLALCGAASLALLPVGAQAFEIQGEDTDLPESAAEALGLNPIYTLPQFEGSSLAMPYSSSASDAGYVSDYGNSIAIPAPGLSQPTPAWQSSPYFR
jgi:hypothetical protein